MKVLLFALAAAILLAGVVLVIGDFPMIEARFPAVGPAMIGFGFVITLAVFYIERRKL